MKKFFTLIAAVASAMTAFAGNTLENADFTQGVMPEVNIATYASDGAVNHLQEVPGWTIAVENIDARAAGVMAYGSGTSLGGSYYAPAEGPEGTNGNCLGMVAVWNGSAQYTQDVTLPAGAYTLTVPVCNTAGTTAFVKNLIGVKIGATEKYATALNYPLNTWTNEVFAFELAEETTVTVSLGYNGANAGSAASQHLFFDCVKLEAVSALDVAKADAIKALPVADGSVFTPAAADIEAVKAAIEAATTVEEVAAAVPAAWDIPALTGSFYVKNTNGSVFLAAAKLSAEPVAIKFEKAEGGFYINVEGSYLNMKGGDTWSMSATETPAAVWKFNLADGKYTIQGPNGLIGSDNTNDGSSTYGNKKINETAKNIFWTIEAAPVLSEYTVYAKVTADDLSKKFEGMLIKVSEKDGVATVTLPAAQAGPFSMESQKVQVNIAEGAISMVEGQTLNFKQGNDVIVVTVTGVDGTLADEKLNVTVTGTGSNGKDVKVIYSTDKIKDIITKERAWDFTSVYGSPAQAEMTGATDFWGNESKGRLFYIVAADDEELQGAQGALSVTEGLYFTVDASKLLIGATSTANPYLQIGGNGYKIRIPNCGKGDVITVEMCCATKNKTTSLSSDNIDENITDVGTSKVSKTAVVSEDGDVVLTTGTDIRIYTLTVTPNDPTAAKATEAAKAAKVAKFFQNGKVVIVKDGKKYNVAGQEM